MDILIIGTGYVGLVTGVCFAEMGHHVTCLDIDQEKIDKLNQGIIPIYEPGLAEVLKRNLSEGRLKFTTRYPKADAYFICVPTPSSFDGSADLSYVKAAAKEIALNLTGYAVIVNKSTVPVGTADLVKEIMHAHTTQPFDVVSNPEFLKEGSAVADCMKPDRVIIGSESPKAIERMKKIYAAFTHNHDRILVMDPRSAELTKYAANAMLATRISFMNEMAGLCEKLGANVGHIRIGIGSDRRIGFDFLYPGAGYGGSCFPKDIRALTHTARTAGYEMHLVNAVNQVNEKQKKKMHEKLMSYFGSLRGLKIAIWGLSFKPDTDDIRESASIALVKQLLVDGAIVRVYDPIAMDNAKREISQATFCTNELDAVEGVDAIVLMTEWKQFRYVTLKEVKDKMKGHAFFDGRNQYNSSDMIEAGFDYFPIGAQNSQALLKKLHETAHRLSTSVAH